MFLLNIDEDVKYKRRDQLRVFWINIKLLTIKKGTKTNKPRASYCIKLIPFENRGICLHDSKVNRLCYSFFGRRQKTKNIYSVAKVTTLSQYLVSMSLNIWRKNWFLRCALRYLVFAKFSFQGALESITQNLISKMHLKIWHKFGFWDASETWRRI